MAHPYRKQVDVSEARRARELSGGMKVRDVGFDELTTGKAPRAPRPEKHTIPVEGGEIHLQRRFASGGAVRDVSIVLKASDGREQRMKFKDGGFVEAKPSRAKLRPPKVIV